MTLGELKLYIENMYDQLDPDKIDEWEVDGLEIYDTETDKTLILKIEELRI